MSEPSTGDIVPSETGDAAPAQASTDPAALERIAARTRPLVRERLRAALDGRTAAGPTAELGPPTELDDAQLDRIVDEEAERADGPLLHVAVIHAVSAELGIEIEDALEHPAVPLTRERLRPPGGIGPDSHEPHPREPGTNKPDSDTPGTDQPGSDKLGTDATPEGVPPAAPATEVELGAAPTDDPAPLARPSRQRALLLDAVHVFGIETLEPGDEDIELRLADAGIDVRKPSTSGMIGRLRWNEVKSVAVQRPRRGLPGRRRPALFVAGTDQGEVTFELPGLSDEEITEHLEPLIARNCASYAGSAPD